MPVPRTHLLARPRTIQRACGWFDGCTWSPATDVPERGSGRLEEVEMGQRLKTLGFASLLTLLAALPVARSADAASVSRQCRRACRDQVAACIGAGGHPRAGRKSVLRRCTQEGVAACQGQADATGRNGLNNGRHPKSTTTTTTTSPTTTRPPTTTTTITARSTTTTTLIGGGGPVTGLHYAPNNNFDSSGRYSPGTAGFNLADVSSVSELDSLPSGVKGLVWLGLCNGADSSFINAVRPFIGHPKLFGFYVMDEPDPTGQWGPLCTAAHLMAEADWIHANVPGAQTFIVMMNFNTSVAPTYANTYNPGNSHIDLYGIDPYPCRTETNGCDYDMITVAVAAAKSSGIPLGSIVPVYQAFGGGSWADDGGGKYTLPTSSQAQQIMSTWAPMVPNPVFDYAYSWGTQSSDQALEGSPALQAVFAAHNAASAGATTTTTITLPPTTTTTTRPATTTTTTPAAATTTTTTRPATTTTTASPAATSTTTTRPPATTTTSRSTTTTTLLGGGSGPVTRLHYAPNNNMDSSGHYSPGTAGFNLADVSSVSELDSLPGGVKGLVWLGLCNGADSSFINAVQPFIGNPKLFGFYLMDEPDPTGQWGPLCTAAHLMAEADWIHANAPGAQT